MQKNDLNFSYIYSFFQYRQFFSLLFLALEGQCVRLNFHDKKNIIMQRSYRWQSKFLRSSFHRSSKL